MRRFFPKGMTLVEAVLYIGIIILVLPFLVNFVLHMNEEQELFESRLRMEQSASLVFSELSYQLTAADEILVSTSTLNANPSSLRITSHDGHQIIIDCPTVSVTFPGGTQSVRRLRMRVDANDPVYLTDGDIDVTEWKVVALRDSMNALTGLRVSMDYSMLHPGTDAFRSAAFAADTTIALSPHTVER